MHVRSRPLSITLVLVGAMCASTAGAVPASATVPGGDGLIAYDREDAIWVVDATGANHTQLTNLGGGTFNRHSDPSWSPDGTQIAFVDRVQVAGIDDMDINVMNADGTDIVNLTKTNTIDEQKPAWSPDGTQIAYEADADIWVVDVATGARTNLTNSPCKYDWDPAWSPDGTRLAIVHGRIGDCPPGTPWTNPRIHLLTVATGDIELLVSTDTAQHPSWSPDGSQLAFAVRSVTSEHIWTVQADGTGAAAFTNGGHGWGYTGAAWSPSGDFIAVSVVDPAGAVPQADLRALTMTGGYVALSDTTTVDERNPDWQPVNRAPTAVGDPVAVANGGTVTGNVLGNDTDPDGDTLTAAKVGDPDHGTATVAADGSFTYTHDGSVATGDSFTYRAHDGEVHSNVATVAVTIAPMVKDTMGLVDPTQGRWHLRNTAGVATQFYFGNPGDFPIMGDWDCDGIDTPGMYRQSDGFVYLRNTNTAGIGDIRFFFGNPGDVPLAGDFDGDGCDTVSIYRPADARFYIINDLGADEGGLGAAETDYLFGNSGDKPFVGDFDGDGVETVGLHRESTGLVYFRQSHTQGPADAQFIYGDPGDRLVAGDWNGNGGDSPALFRPGNTTCYFRFTNTQGLADDEFVFGEPSWLPVAGAFGLG